jgi:hypothetical protein
MKMRAWRFSGAHPIFHACKTKTLQNTLHLNFVLLLAFPVSVYRFVQPDNDKR